MDRIKRLMQNFCEDNELEDDNNACFNFVDESGNIVPGVIFKIKGDDMFLAFADYKNGSWKETERFELKIK